MVARQVRVLRLGASRREQVSHAAIALEDALRTASLPLPRNGVLLVRRLNLGRLPRRASPQWLSQRIEARMRDVRPTLIRGAQDDPSASAVWFVDRSHALAALLASTVRQPPRAWYWAGILPGWRPRMRAPELLPRVLREAAARADAGTEPSAVAALLDRLLVLGVLDDVLGYLDRSRLTALGPSGAASWSAPHDLSEPATPPPPDASRRIPAPREEGQRRTSSDPTKPAGGSVRVHSTPAAALIANAAWQATLARWSHYWGTTDPRTRWLAAHGLVAVHGPAALAQLDRLTRPLATEVRIESGTTSREVPSAKPATTVRQKEVRDAEQPGSPNEPELDDRHTAQGRAEAGHLDDHAERPGPPEAERLPPFEPDWQPSQNAGLLLLLPALERLQIAEADEVGDLCLHLLHRIGDRLKIRHEDMIRRALPRPLPPSSPRAFTPPTAWQGLRLPRGIDFDTEQGVLIACQLVLARFLRRYAKTSLRPLVRRPAMVHATRTHIDLRFDACWVDLDLRLAGLDLDPGWVPWLGRVVSFHYDYEGLA